MGDITIGAVISGPDTQSVVSQVHRAEEMGISAAWLTSSGGLDPMTLLSAAASSTSRILLGTAIMPTFLRHPLVAADQARVIAQLVPGRFRLGVGPSSKAGMVDSYGVNFRAPLGHLREYVRILKSLLQGGSVDLDGRYYRAKGRSATPVDALVMTSALGRGAFELCGAESDGAITWLCPAPYLRDVALPALAESARQAGRAVPPLIAHAPVCVHDDATVAREVVGRQFQGFAGFGDYQRMFSAAGFPDALEGKWTDAMTEATGVFGDEETVEGKLRNIISTGASELILSPVAAGPDREGSLDRTLRLLARLSASP